MVEVLINKLSYNEVLIDMQHIFEEANQVVNLQFMNYLLWPQVSEPQHTSHPN